MENGTTPTVTTLSAKDREALKGMAQWTRLLAILGYIGVGGMIVMVFVFAGVNRSMGTMAQEITAEQQRAIEEAYGPGVDAEELIRQSAYQGSLVSGSVVFLYIILSIMHLIPVILLHQFSKRVRYVLDGPFDADVFTSALNAHRRMYKYIGILALIFLGLFLMIFSVTRLFTQFSSMM
jgi:hypothetical protein